MLLVPGRNAISLVLPRSPRASIVFGLLLPLLSGVVAQRYVSSVVAGNDSMAMASLARITNPVSTVSAALRAHSAPLPRIADEVDTTSPPSATDELDTESAPVPTHEPSHAARVVDVKSMLRTLWGLRRGTASPDDVERIPRSGVLRIEALHLNEAIAVHPFTDDGQPDPAALKQVEHVMRCRITNHEASIDPQLIEILVRLHALYGRAIQLVSGHRQPNTIGTKETSQHALGKAADIRIPGVSIEELKRVAMRLGARGVGLYPEKGFVHVDVRQKTRYSWVYTEARGEQPDWSLPQPRRTGAVASTTTEQPVAEAEVEHEPDAESERRAD